ncbi:hypothetical protein [Actinomycetospora chiangmaiensis]|uniref:hypothetical protein n=1 Tax=Actinomycetospora chiangmaiensis TaxID=402650 RepID=UPI0012F80925|nr:hypothetical protein [Actinomycetospora chiangmaiensis]
MKLLSTGTPVSGAVLAQRATAHVCRWDRVAVGAQLVRTRAFAAVPSGPVTTGGIPMSGLPGSRPAGSPDPQRHVDLAPQSPRPSGGQPQD